ncbi:MAG: hypothetical protein GY730_07885 [bacterium]|nr:hypothetical protein [bacterium]
MTLNKYSKIMNDIISRTKQIYSDSLISFYIYGENTELQTLNKEEKLLLLILNTVSTSKLKKQRDLQPVLIKNNFKLTIFTEDEIKHSLDVFPVEFMEMKENRKLLSGVDILDNVTIDPKNLRHECEFYLRSHILKLREAYIAPGRDINKLIKLSLPSFISVFKQFIKMDKEEIVIADNRDIIHKLSEKLDFNKGIFLNILDSIPKTRLEQYFDQYLTELEKITMQIDQLYKK